MAYSKVGRCSTDIEAVTFGTPPGTWIDQRLVRESLDMSNLKVVGESMEDMTVVPTWHGENMDRLGGKFPSEIPLPFYLEGLAAADVLNQAAAYAFPQANVAEILDGLMGGSRGAAGSITAGVPTDSVIDVAAGEGGRFPRGSIAGFTVAGSVVECRQIADQTVDTLKPHMALSAAPAAAKAVYNAECIYLDNTTAGGGGHSLAFRILGEDAGDQWTLNGCAGGFTIAMELNGLLLMTVQLRVANPLKTSGHTLAGAIYVGGAPIPIRIGEVQYGANSTGAAIARTLLPCESFGVTPGVSYEREGSLSGVETVNRWRQMSPKPRATLRVRSHIAFDAYWTDYAAQATKQVGIQIGNTVGAGGTGIVYIHLPCVQFAKEPVRIEEGGFVLTDLEFKAMPNLAGGTSALETSPIVIGLL